MGANKEQLQAIQSNSDRILCLAGAGAGKHDPLCQLQTDGRGADSADHHYFRGYLVRQKHA